MKSCKLARGVKLGRLDTRFALLVLKFLYGCNSLRVMYIYIYIYIYIYTHTRGRAKVDEKKKVDLPVQTLQ